MHACRLSEEDVDAWAALEVVDFLQELIVWMACNMCMQV
jgi:hypothetical protein